MTSPAIAADTDLLWMPQPRQSALISCPFDDVLFGGARGGGKTDAVLGDWLNHSYEFGKYANAVVLRRSAIELEDMISRAQTLFTPLGADWHEQKKIFLMPNGSRIRFRYLEREADAMRYQGHQYTKVYCEELGNWPTSKAVDLMYGTLRSAYGIPCTMRSTANPGGPGHAWVKDRYITPAPMGFEPIITKLPSGREFIRCFIPSKLGDNLILKDNDPGYEDRLYLVGSAALVRAWLDGDWNAVEGAYFDGWSDKMIIPPFAIPKEWVRFRSFDWGYARPFSVGWWAVSDGNRVALPGGGYLRLPRGAIIRYREWYGCVPGQPNTGLRLEVEDIADGILKMENEEVEYGVADPSIWDASRGPSIAERFAKYRPLWDKDKLPVVWRRGDNKRITGWSQVRGRMRPSEEGSPMIYLFGTCKDSVRLMPIMQHDKTKAEDLDTEAEDHVADEWRYACMSRPMPNIVAAPRKARNPLTLDAMAPVIPHPTYEGHRYSA